MRRILSFVVAVCLILTMVLAGARPAEAAGATIIFAPTAVSVASGGQASVTVLVSSDTPMSGLDFYLSFPQDKVSVSAVDMSGSEFNLVIHKDIDNSGGTVHFTISTITAGGVTNAKVATLAFQAKAAGSGSLGVKAGGVATDYSPQANKFPLGSSGGSVTVQSPAQATPPPADNTPSSNSSKSSFKPTTSGSLAISSSTHPDQDKWYNNRQVNITWSGGGTAYNYAFDQSSTTQLSDKSNGTLAAAGTTLSGDGIWYAHVRSQTSSGWGATSHFRIQVDTVSPDGFKVSSSPDQKGSIMPTLTFSSNDNPSGIDHFELSTDGGDWSTISSPYKLSGLSVADHTFKVKAVDRAGNATTADLLKYTLDPPEAPVITYPSNKQLFVLGQSVTVKGKAASDLSVDIYLNDKKIATTKTDDNGNFTAPEGLLLFAGAYKLVAKAVTQDGISSPYSSPVAMTIDAKAVQLMGVTMPGWLALAGALVIFAALLLAIGWLLRYIWKLSKLWLQHIAGMKVAVHDDLKILEEQLDHDIDQLVEGDIGSVATVKQGMAQALDTAEENMNAAADDMMIDEPIVPILHGPMRFVEDLWPHHGKDLGTQRVEDPRTQGPKDPDSQPAVVSETTTKPAPIEAPIKPAEFKPLDIPPPADTQAAAPAAEPQPTPEVKTETEPVKMGPPPAAPSPLPAPPAEDLSPQPVIQPVTKPMVPKVAPAAKPVDVFAPKITSATPGKEKA